MQSVLLQQCSLYVRMRQSGTACVHAHKSRNTHSNNTLRTRYNVTYCIICFATWQAYPPFRASRHPSRPPRPPPPFYLAPPSKIAGHSRFCRPSCSQHRGERGLGARDFQVATAFKGKGGLSATSEVFMRQR